MSHRLFEPILQILYDTMPRDNLLNSACLELFEFIKRENIKGLVTHLVENYRDKLQAITYVDTFQNLILRYDQMHEPPPTQELDNSFTSVESDTPARTRPLANGGRWDHGLKGLDPDEEAYFNTSDEEEDGLPNPVKPVMNGASPLRPLVNYPDDDDDDAEDEMDILTTSTPTVSTQTTTASTQTPQTSLPSPPERLSEKRRREEDEEDELLARIASAGSKRRASGASNASQSSTGSSQRLRRQRSISSGKDGGGPKKMPISITLKSTAATETSGGGEKE